MCSQVSLQPGAGNAICQVEPIPWSKQLSRSLPFEAPCLAELFDPLPLPENYPPTL